MLGLAIEDALLEAGAQSVSICPSASCTLALLREQSYEAIVLDVQLNDSEQGWEIAELVQAMGHQNVKIVFQTGNPDRIPENMRELGPVLTKPYDPAELIEALKKKASPGLLSLLAR